LAPKPKLTILLTLKDRSIFTYRWLEYAQFVNLPFKVFIADGGLSDEIANNLGNSSKYPKVDYCYFRYPPDTSYYIYYSKVVDALSKIDTEYVVMADNDDFFIVKGLEKSIIFMDEHPDFSCCRGTIGTVNIKTNSKKNFESVYGEKVVFDIFKVQSNLKKNASERIKFHFSTFNLKNYYSATFYDVHRTKDLMKYYKILKDLDLKDLYLAELLLSYLTVSDGKVKRGSYNYLIRQTNSSGSSASTHQEKWGDHFDRMFHESWSEDFSNFTNAIAKSISSKDKINLDTASYLVKKGYREYISPHIINCISNPNVLTKILRKLDRIVYLLMQKVLIYSNIKDLKSIKFFIQNRHKLNNKVVDL